jgi:hypothetical protein
MMWFMGGGVCPARKPKPSSRVSSGLSTPMITAMDQGLLDLCGNIIEARFDKLLEQNFKTKVRYHDGRTYVEIPIVGNWCLVENVANFKPIACRATVAKLEFDWMEPDWAPLPTHVNNIAAAMREPNLRRQAVAHYADSRWKMDWDPAHASFNDYLAGMAALPSYTNGFCIIRGTGLKIAPRPLAGLDPETLIWDERKMIETYIDMI